MSVDERALGALLEESNDLQSDAMHATREPLRELVESGQERRAHGGLDLDEQRRFTTERNRLVRSSLCGKGAFATLGFGAALLALFDSPAFAGRVRRADAADGGVAREPRGRDLRRRARRSTSSAAHRDPGGEGVRHEDRDQHKDHAEAFNAAVTRLGGKEQTEPDPVLLEVVNNAKPTLTGPGPVVDLAIRLEDTAAQTYVANIGALTDKSARAVTASIMGVEAQHVPCSSR